MDDNDELDPVKIGAKFGWNQAQIDALAACLKEQKVWWLPVDGGWVPSDGVDDLRPLVEAKKD
jgi:hypothetical protein